MTPFSGLTATQIGQLLVFSVMLSCGQFMFKLAATKVPALRDVSAFVTLATNPITIAAIALYGAATILWIFILQKVPLSVAYPFVALGFVIIPIGAWLVFGEPITLRYVIGVGCILTGLLLIVK